MPREQGRTLEPGEREVMMWKAFEMSTKRMSLAQIGRELDVTPRCAKKLRNDAAEAYRKENAHQGPMAVHTFEMVIQQALETKADIEADPKRANWREIPALLRVIIDAQEQIVLLGGWRPAVKSAVVGKVQHEVKYLNTDAMTVEQMEEYERFLESLPMKELE